MKCDSTALSTATALVKALTAHDRRTIQMKRDGWVSVARVLDTVQTMRIYRIKTHVTMREGLCEGTVDVSDII